ncbi:hypothetical protein D3C76_286340 [compost metagenome]
MEIRRVKENELDQAVALANIVFCNNVNGHMGTCFPTLFQPGISHSYGAFSPDGKLVSFMGLVPVRIGIGGNRSLKAFSVGAVCTDPAFRGLGLAGKLLETCHQHAREAGASVIFISGDRSLYLRGGSVFFGSSHKITLAANEANSAMHPPAPAAWSFRDLIPGDILTIHELLCQKTGGFEWGVTDLQQCIGTGAYATLHKKSQQIRVACSGNNEIAAALIMMIPDENTPPQERDGLIIEWAGNASAAHALIVDAISHFQLPSLSVFLPWQDTELLHLLQKQQIQSEKIKNAGTLLVADEQALLRQAGLNDASKETHILNLGDQRYELHTRDKKIIIEGSSQLSAVLFDPETIIYDSDLSVSNPFAIPLPYMYGLYFI